MTSVAAGKGRGGRGRTASSESTGSPAPQPARDCPLFMECEDEELSEAQVAHYGRKQQEFMGVMRKLEDLAKQGAKVTANADNSVTFRVTETTSTLGPVTAQPAGPGNQQYRFLMDPKTGRIIGSIPSQPGGAPPVLPSPPGMVRAPTATPPPRAQGGRGRGSSRGRQPVRPALTPSPAIQPAARGRTPPSRETTPSKPGSSQPALVDLTKPGVEPVGAQPIRKAFPALSVSAKPQRTVPNASAKRSELDAKVKGLLVHTPAKFTEWLIQQGLVRSEQFEVGPQGKVKLKLGMYSDGKKFPHSGGYVWIQEGAANKYTSVYKGSIFEAATHPPTVILKLMYHWSCQTNIPNVAQWVKVDNPGIDSFFALLRGVCVGAVQEEGRTCRQVETMNVLKHWSGLNDSPTYYVVQLHRKCSDEAAQLIHDKLVLDWDRGGGGLLVRRQLPTSQFPETVLHVSASNQHLMKVADLMELKKQDSEGHLRPFCVDEAEEFPATGRVGPLDISDIHRCVQYAMERIHFDTNVLALPGHPGRSVMRGAPVLSSYEEVRLVSVFPLHDDQDLDRLNKAWGRTVFHPPLDQIRNYFGESVALYWSFAESYTKFLFLIAIIGTVEYLFELFGVNYIYSNLLFSLFNLLCLAFFLELWKRKSAEHSFFWGTSGKLRHKQPRPEYRGELRNNPVTGKEEMFYPASKRLQKIVTISLPLTLLCLLLAFVLMILSFESDRIMAEFLLDEETGEIATDFISKVLINLPSVLYSLSIILFNSLYLKLARRLTTWENHRTQEQHDTHITLKLITFEFVNTFLALFYLGFYLQDLAGLRSQLFTTLIVQQIVNQVQEVAVPLLMHRPASVKLLHKLSKKLGVEEKPQARNLSVVSDMNADDERVKLANHDTLAEPLDSLHDDFMELWLQFGHVFLFSAVYPLSACFALLNNLTELFADRYKLCRLSRKPRPRAVRDIGAWYLAFRITAILSICSNCALLGLDLRETAGSGWSDLGWFGLLVLVEHLFLVVFLGVNRLVSDTPAHVKLAMDRTDFHFKQKHVKST